MNMPINVKIYVIRNQTASTYLRRIALWLQIFKNKLVG